MHPTDPESEARRLSALRDLKILDTPREERFDRLTRLVARYFSVPLAMVSLAGKDRQWVKSCSGPAQWASGDLQAFIGRVVAAGEILVVPDAAKDPGCAGGAAASTDRCLRFFGGAPLTLRGGETVGALCIMDRRAGELSADQREAFREFAGAIVTELEDRLLEEQVQAAARAKSQFLANISHELRTPLTAILGFGDLLADETLSKADRFDCAASMRRSGECLISLIEDLIRCAELASGEPTVHLRPFRPAAILRGVADSLGARTRESGVVLDVRWLGDEVEVVSDLPRIQDIARHLLSNAVKFTPGGSIFLTGEIARGPGAPATLAITVRDTGVGLDVEAVEQFFAPFGQADSTPTRRFGGAGLGLAITARTVHLLGGSIQVQSQPGRGSSFTVRIPVELGSPAVENLTPAANRAA